MKGVPLLSTQSATRNLRLARPKLAIPISNSTHPKIVSWSYKLLQHPYTMEVHMRKEVQSNTNIYRVWDQSLNNQNSYQSKHLQVCPCKRWLLLALILFLPILWGSSFCLVLALCGSCRVLLLCRGSPLVLAPLFGVLKTSYGG